MNSFTPSLTYDAVRSNAERIADADLKERVLKGIALLNEKFGPDWVDEIDPSELLLSSPTQCVLGQLYDRHVPTQEQIDALLPVNELAWQHCRKPASPIAVEGYWKGLAILDGDVAADPGAFGFDIESDGGEAAYDPLTEAWLIALGSDQVFEAEDD